MDNIGRFVVVKEAFGRHLGKAINSILPVTPKLEEYTKRTRLSQKIAMAEDRMVDHVEEMLNTYHKKENQGLNGLHAPLPMVLIGFARDMLPADVSILGKPNSSLSPTHICTEHKTYHYGLRTTNLENRVQILFVAHETETLRAMTAQTRLWFQGFMKRSFPIVWKWGGHEFTYQGSIDDVNFVDVIADLGERTNVNGIIWDLTIRFQMPFMYSPYEGDDEYGKRIGYKTVEDVMIDIQHGPKIREDMDVILGYVDGTTEFGEWNIERSEKDR